MKKGFTLIELILSLTIASILILVLSSILNIGLRIDSKIEDSDRYLSTGRYALDYLSKEIRFANTIYKTNEQIDKAYKNNLGYVLLNKTGDMHQYLFYYLENKKLMRYSVRNKMSYAQIDIRKGDIGINTVVGEVESLQDSTYDVTTGIVDLQLLFTDNESMETKIFKIGENAHE